MERKGYYLFEDRCFYLTGTKSGNKWIYFDDKFPEWVSLIWTCKPKNLQSAKFSESNPTSYKKDD